MTDSILDNNTLIRMAGSLAAQNNLSIGIYDADGVAVLPCDLFSETDCMSTLSKLKANNIENVIDLSTGGNRASALAMRDTKGSFLGMWMISASPSDPVPFDSHLSAIETVVSAYLTERYRAFSLSENIRDKEKEGSTLSNELAQNSAITEILGNLESEDDFEKVAGQIITISGEFLKLSNIFILQLDKDDDSATVLVEWHDKSKDALTRKLDRLVLSELPFADGLSYTVSSDSRMPEAFRGFLQAHDISAGIFLPIFLDSQNIMYLCATMDVTPRHWSLSEAGFLSDVKRVLSTILAKRVAKNSLASSYAVVESVLENIGCGVLVMEQEEGDVLYTNDTFRVMFSNLSDKQRFERRIRQTPEKMEQIREYYVENAGIFVSIALGIIRWVDDRPVRLATVFDITENKEFEKKIEKQANIDELTGIYNRTFFIKELGSLLSKPHAPGAYICMNVDGFKEVNVTSGNEGGDLLLSSIAKFLLKLSGEYAKVYRLGADEFAIIVKDSSKVDPAELAKSLVKRFKAPWQLAYKDCYLTVSVGISLFPKDGDDVASVVKCGDIALSEARKRGPESVRFFVPEMEKDLRNSILFRSFLMDAIENNCNGMELVTNSASFIINGEAFDGYIMDYKWEAPELGTKESFHFMPVARSQNAAGPIIAALFEETLKECRYKNDFGYPESCAAIVVDAEDFAENDISEFLKKAIEVSSVNPDRIIIIVRGIISTENTDRLVSEAESIKKQGVHIALAYPMDEMYMPINFDARVI